MINEHVNDSLFKNCFPQNDIKVMFHMDKIWYFVACYTILLSDHYFKNLIYLLLKRLIQAMFELRYIYTLQK